ncbi:MAG: TraB domain-containing protein [Methanomassiliicoccales archaeon]|nr:TraB domain-containing protein [Methanomassiliicoccales archaeon]
MIVLIGVGHVFDIGGAVKSLVIDAKPGAVCLELDEGRLAGLLTKQHGEVTSRTYKSLGDFQSKMAESYGTTVGSEMLAAYEAAQLIGARIYCIDMNASEFFDRAFKSMSLREKVYLLINSFMARFTRKKKIEKELKQYEENGAEYIEEFGRRFPSLKKVLIDDRNTHMADRIRKIAEDSGNVAVIVGDGHVDGLKSLIDDLQVSIVRLKDLRDMQERGATAGTSGSQSGNSQATFSFSYR